MIYFLFFAFSYLAVVLQTEKTKSIWYLLVALFAILISSLRYNLGADYLGYLSYFNKVDILRMPFIEPLFYYAMIVVKTIGLGYHSFLFTVVALTFFIFQRTIKKSPVNASVVLFVFLIQYFLGGIMGQIRQCLAIVIVMLAFHQLYLGKKKRFYFYVILSGLVHYTGFLGFFLPGILSISEKSKFQVMYLFLLVVVSQLNLSEIFIELIGRMSGFSVVDTLLFYSDNEKHSSAYSLGTIAIIERVIVGTFSFFLWVKSDDKYSVSVAKIYLFSILLLMAFYDFAILSQRLSRVFKLFEVFIYAIAFRDYFTRNAGSKLVFYFVMMITMLKPIVVIRADYKKYLPYKTVGFESFTRYEN